MMMQNSKSPVFSSIDYWLLASSIFSCLLLFFRMVITGSLAYVFLPWNLFLGFIPYWLSRWMAKDGRKKENKLKFYFVFGLWLLFIPNSFYIITDLFHLTHIGSAPKWFDILLVFSFAWNGIIAGILSLRSVENMLTPGWGRHFSFMMVSTVMWLSAWGVYIGRFLRYNSWDIITNPFSLAGDIAEMVFHPVQNMYTWGMTILYAVFMTLLYFTIKKLGESFIINPTPRTMD
jgi:uncharacterized membrane protein